MFNSIQQLKELQAKQEFYGLVVAYQIVGETKFKKIQLCRGVKQEELDKILKSIHDTLKAINKLLKEDMEKYNI